METTLVFLNQRFEYWLNCLLKYSRTDFPMEECDCPVVAMTQLPCDWAEMLQIRRSHSIQRIHVFDLVHYWYLATQVLIDSLSDFGPGDEQPHPWFSGLLLLSCCGGDPQSTSFHFSSIVPSMSTDPHLHWKWCWHKAVSPSLQVLGGLLEPL